MFTTLLLPFLAAADPVVATRAAQADDPAVQLWISNDRRFLPGDRAKVHVRADYDGYLLVLHADPDGHLRVLFPLDPKDDNFVRGRKKYEVEGRGGREAFTVDVNTGRGTVYAALARAPFRYDAYILGDHWDYRTLTEDRLPREPEAELTEIVRRMAQGSFDYDILTYDVIERVVYADDNYVSRPIYRSYHYYDSFYYDDPWCGGYYFRRCGGLSLGIYFGRPYRRSPYFYGYYPAYDPFYDPFFYDPYYYRPAYYYPYRSYGYYRPYRPYHPWYRDYAWPRYRDRRRDVFTAGYRERDYGFRRSVNTVYQPPVSRFGESERSDPVRRLVDDRVVGGSAGEESRRERASDTPRRARDNEAPRRDRAGQEPRRTTTDRPEPAVERRPSGERRQVEARRAREPEPTRMRSVNAESYDRGALPVEVGRPSVERRSIDRGSTESGSAGREPVRVQRPSPVEARPARRAEPSAPAPRAEPRAAAPRAEPRAPAPRAEPRSYGGDRGGSPSRAERSGSSRSAGASSYGGGGSRGSAPSSRSGGGGRRR